MTAAVPFGARDPSAGRTNRPAIHVAALRKRYGALDAVRGVTFDVRPGEIFGVIGPDGAGKTSTFQILAGVMEATSGTAEVFGRPAREMRSQTGYLTQTFSLYPDLSVAENLQYIGDLRRIPRSEIETRGHRYLQMFDMDRFQHRLAGDLSGGMKQKLSLASALVPQPRVLLLDEPTTGVDPVSRREFWDALAHLAADGLTILVATPYLDEAERCNRVALMYDGAMHHIGTPPELRNRLHATRLEVRTPALHEAEQILTDLGESHHEFLDTQRFGDRLDVLVQDSTAAERTLRARLREARIPVDEIRRDEPLLENTFVATLRSLGRDVQPPPFPHHHDHQALVGQIAIGATHLTKQFGSFVAVNDVTLQVRFGEVYGLLGANGAGKTTTIKMLCGLLDPTRGSVQLAGASDHVRSPEVRQRIGYMSQKFSLYEDLPVYENLMFFAGIYGLPEDERAEKLRWVLRFAGLEGHAHQLTGSLPGGWKQRVALGAAIMHEPSVLFLDEPTSGVDPLARRAFWRLIDRLADMGTAILVTTHYLEEAEECNRLGIMANGALIAEGTPSGLKSQQRAHLIELVVDDPQRAADRLKQHLDPSQVSFFGDRLHVLTDEDPDRAQGVLTATLTAAGIRIIHAREARVSLEDVFIRVIHQARRTAPVVSDA